MWECICNSCRNLKSVLNEDGAVESYECVYGYPSESCKTCEDGECELSCINYISDEEEIEPVIVKCITCGRELHQMCSSEEEGNIQCIDCFLKE